MNDAEIRQAQPDPAVMMRAKRAAIQRPVVRTQWYGAVVPLPASCSGHYLIDRDRQVADPLAGGVEYAVSDRGSGADDPELAQPLYAKRRDVGIRLVNEDHIYVTDIGMYRHVILGEIVVHDAADAVIGQRLLLQRHPKAHHDPTDDLAAGGLGIDDAAGGSGADDPRHPDHTQLLVDADLGEDGAVGVMGHLLPVPGRLERFLRRNGGAA